MQDPFRHGRCFRSQIYRVHAAERQRHGHKRAKQNAIYRNDSYLAIICPHYTEDLSRSSFLAAQPHGDAVMVRTPQTTAVTQTKPLVLSPRGDLLRIAPSSLFGSLGLDSNLDLRAETATLSSVPTQTRLPPK